MVADIIKCSSADCECGTMQLCLESVNHGGLKLTAENHDGDIWETDEFDPIETIIRIFIPSSEEERERIMAVDFSKFEEKVDLNALQKEVAEAKEFEDVPDGTYIVGIEKMEIVETKAGDKLMFTVSAKVKEGEYAGRFLKFFNRVIYGNTSPKWTDGQAIKSVCTWVNKLLSGDDAPVEFINYEDFAGQILNAFQEVKDTVEVEVEYKADNFNPITINEIFDKE